MQKRFLTWFFVIPIVIFSNMAQALPRDKVQREAFKRENPCPSTGKKAGTCPGYDVDHKKALMNGGKDHPDNMQWSPHEEHKAKTKQDIAECKSSFFCKNKQLRKPSPIFGKRDRKQDTRKNHNKK